MTAGVPLVRNERAFMQNIGVVLVKLAAVVAAFVMIISAIYVWVLPAIFHGYGTRWIFIVGVIGASLLGGYDVYRSYTVEFGISRWLLASICAVVVGALVALFSLWIVLNVRGS